MARKPVEIISLDDIEIEQFDHDPDGDPDRAGDGLYFKLPGEETWSGVWHSEEQCLEEAEEELKAREMLAWQVELEADGYSRLVGTSWPINPDDGEASYFRYARKDEDAYRLICVAERPSLVEVASGGSAMEHRVYAISVSAGDVEERLVDASEIASVVERSWEGNGKDGLVVFAGDDVPDGKRHVAFIDLDLIGAALMGDAEGDPILYSDAVRVSSAEVLAPEYGHIHRMVREAADSVSFHLEARNSSPMTI